MKPPSPLSLEELFHSIVAAPHRERPAMIEQACGSDRALRRDLEALLAADESPGGVLDRPASRIRDRMGDAALCAGQEIGPYEIVRLIAAGGMGNVYEAVQRRPRRTVALKLLRTAFATRSERRRFAYESELLGRLRHPNIAQIFESGIHENGVVSLPYFAMEYIPGAQTLTAYAQERALPTRERLELFVHVCDAVQHGHQKGIVHRDLKPGNILVDAAGIPKVIDYGVARPVDRAGETLALCTTVGEFVGTLQYMSPEQIRGDATGIDTRCDVYSLGLILHELVTDRRPYELGGLTLPDALLAVESEPTVSLRGVARDLRGDLATIIRKAMSRDAMRRYQSSGELADDICRLLRKEPIAARPPSTWYQIRRFGSRHRTLVAAAIISLLALALGAVAATHWALEARTQRDQALLAAERAEQVIGFIERLVASADPKTSGYGVTAREMVDRAADQIDEQFAEDPVTAARVHHLLGGIYVRQQRPAEARRHLRAALAIARRLEQPPGCWTADTLCDLAWLPNAEDPTEPERLFLEAYEIRHRLFGPLDTTVLRTLIYRCGALQALARFEETESLLRDALDALEQAGEGQSESAALGLRYLAHALHARRADDEAELLYRQSLALQQQLTGPDDLEMAFLLGTFADFLWVTCRVEEAQALRAWRNRILDLRYGPDRGSREN